MHHVRQDYLWYERRPHFEHGFEIRDLLVFRRELDAPELTFDNR